MIKFFDEIDENGSKDICFSNFYWPYFLNKLIIRLSKQSVCYKSGVDVRHDTETSCGGREKQKTQCRGKEMKRLIEVLKPEKPLSEPEGHSKPCADPIADDQKACIDSTPAEGNEKGSFNQKAADEKNEINNHARKGDKSMAALESKFESTKRKLQESYKNIENGIRFLFLLFFSKEKT